ncbi:hypothetical protein V1520DRAFT_152773 [Lipomyces starkeyi]|uniref:Uncharacterized protein n=1 Tax=Lipomyces starkeyi NRRL Y-11557 TaxID=675824 RepID=A0A1E3PYY3_LIPST|nr:hypothetical protein LIPSTDRAFT_29970 [Lipomyces starkeyi NRRL Y-11557]
MKSVAYCPQPPPPPMKRQLRGARPYRHRTSPKLLTPPPQARSKAYPPCDVASTPLGTSQKTRLQVSPVAGSYLGVHCANNNGSRERQIHRGNAHHEHIFADDLVYSPQVRPQSESMGWSPAVPKSVVKTKTRKLRVSSVPILLSPPPDLPKHLKASVKYRGIESAPALPTSHQRKNGISSVPLPPAPCSPEFPPAPFPHRGRPTSQRGGQATTSCESARSPSVIDLAFAPGPDAPMPKLWKKAVKKVIGIEGVREYPEVMAEARDGELKSAMPSQAALLVSRLKIKRTKKFNLSDAIYGSIGKEITVDEDEERERRKAVLARLMDDYSDWREIRDSENDGKEPCVDARLAQRSIASMPVRTSSIIVVNRLQPVVNDTNNHESGNALKFDSVHTLREDRRSPVTMATSLYETGNTDEQLDWPDLPPIAPLNIRRASNSSRRRSMPGMGLLDLQALLVARISAATTASKSAFPYLEIPGNDLSKSDTDTLAKRVARKRISILSGALLSPTIGAIRKDRLKRVMLSRKRLHRALCMFAPAEPEVQERSLATGTGPVGASADADEAAERISEYFLRFTQRAPVLRYFAIPIELAEFVMTLVLFPPRSSAVSYPLDVLARKEALRATVMDATVLGEFICFVWFVYQTCAALHQAFMLVGAMCYPIVTVFGMFVRGM